MDNSKKTRVNQIELFCAILSEIDKQNPGIFASEYQTQVIIEAANDICDAFNKDKATEFE